jgi:hypothetical protein
VVIDELRRLGLDRERVAELVGQAQATFEAGLRPLIERRAKAIGEFTRAGNRSDALLELAEDRLINKEEFAARRARLEGERAILQSELATIEVGIAERAAKVIDVAATVRTLRRVGDVFDELDEVVDRRRLLATCLNCVVVRPGEIELHVPAQPLLMAPAEGGKGSAEVPSQFQFAPAEEAEKRAEGGQNGGVFPCGFSGADTEYYDIRERRGALAAMRVTRCASAPARRRRSAAISAASRDHCSTASTSSSTCRGSNTTS